MTTSATLPARFEQYGFPAALLGLCALLVLVGIAPRSERALFLTSDKLIPAKAFSAVVPPLDPAQSQIEQSLLRSEDARRTRAVDGNSANRGTNPRLASGSPRLLPETLPSLLSTGSAPGTAPGDGTLPDTSTPTTGPASSQPSSSTPPSNGNPPGAPGLPTATAGAPAVAAVPEPATWIMMLFGFFAIGLSVRRRSRAQNGGSLFLR